MDRVDVHAGVDHTSSVPKKIRNVKASEEEWQAIAEVAKQRGTNRSAHLELEARRVPEVDPSEPRRRRAVRQEIERLEAIVERLERVLEHPPDSEGRKSRSFTAGNDEWEEIDQVLAGVDLEVTKSEWIRLRGLYPDATVAWLRDRAEVERALVQLREAIKVLEGVA